MRDLDLLNDVVLLSYFEAYKRMTNGEPVRRAHWPEHIQIRFYPERNKFYVVSAQPHKIMLKQWEPTRVDISASDWVVVG